MTTLQIAKLLAWGKMACGYDGVPLADDGTLPPTPNDVWSSEVSEHGRRNWLAAARKAQRMLKGKGR